MIAPTPMLSCVQQGNKSWRYAIRFHHLGRVDQPLRA